MSSGTKQAGNGGGGKLVGRSVARVTDVIPIKTQFLSERFSDLRPLSPDISHGERTQKLVILVSIVPQISNQTRAISVKKTLQMAE